MEKKDPPSQPLQNQSKIEYKENAQTPEQNEKGVKQAVKNELFDLQFLQNFSFSPTFFS